MKYLYENVDVKYFISKIIEDFSKLMEPKNIKFIQNIEPNLKIKVDKSKLREVFENLIENSIVFVPENDGVIELFAETEGNYVKFSVKDNGKGIPAEKIPNLFKKFHQIDTSHRRTHGGGGLGLTICKGYIDSMGGKIELKSEEGKGTTISFTVERIET
jgi:signal transduction histidine kinase